MSANELNLADTLHEWRKDKWAKDFPGYEGTLIGSFALMSDEVLKRLVALAHAHSDAIGSIQQLVDNVDWCFIEEYAEELLPILRASRTTIPPSRSDQHCPVTSASRPSSPRKCNSCDQSGHYGELCFVHDMSPHADGIVNVWQKHVRSLVLGLTHPYPHNLCALRRSGVLPAAPSRPGELESYNSSLVPRVVSGPNLREPLDSSGPS